MLTLKVILFPEARLAEVVLNTVYALVVGDKAYILCALAALHQRLSCGCLPLLFSSPALLKAFVRLFGPSDSSLRCDSTMPPLYMTV